MCFKEVLGVCGEHFKGVSGVFLRVFEAISSKEFRSSLKGVSRGFLGSFQVFHGSLNTVSRVLWKF